MGLKQINSADRIIFLKKFAAELVINTGKPGLIEKNIQKQIEIEKLRRKFLKPIVSENEGFQPSIFQKPIYSNTINTQEQTQEITSRIKKIRRRQIKFRQRPQQIPVHQLSRILYKLSTKPMQPTIIQKQVEIRPEIQPRPEGLMLGKLESLLKDRSIQSIECPGPEKNVLIKRYNKINTTKITLNQIEITNIINNFAQQAKIPVIGGILKAAVGDMIISAVLSEFVGSRFILNKITPYNLIQWTKYNWKEGGAKAPPFTLFLVTSNLSIFKWFR